MEFAENGNIYQGKDNSESFHRLIDVNFHSSKQLLIILGIILIFLDPFFSLPLSFHSLNTPVTPLSGLKLIEDILKILLKIMWLISIPSNQHLPLSLILFPLLLFLSSVFPYPRLLTQG